MPFQENEGLQRARLLPRKVRVGVRFKPIVQRERQRIQSLFNQADDRLNNLSKGEEEVYHRDLQELLTEIQARIDFMNLADESIVSDKVSTLVSKNLLDKPKIAVAKEVLTVVLQGGREEVEILNMASLELPVNGVLLEDAGDDRNERASSSL